MAQHFEVQLLSPTEYENVVASDPRYVNASDSAAFADPDTGKAFVRDTQWPELSRYLVDHELEHLFNPEDRADRDEHGIYHKKFFRRFLSPIIRFLLPLGGALAAGPAGAALGGAIGEGQFRAAQARHQPDVNATSAGLRGAATGALTAGGIASGNPALGAAGGAAGQAIFQAGSATPGAGSAANIVKAGALGGVGAFGVNQLQGGPAASLTSPNVPALSQFGRAPGQVTTGATPSLQTGVSAGTSGTSGLGGGGGGRLASGGFQTPRLRFGDLPANLTGTAPTTTSLGTQLTSPLAPPSAGAQFGQGVLGAFQQAGGGGGAGGGGPQPPDVTAQQQQTTQQQTGLEKVKDALVTGAVGKSLWDALGIGQDTVAEAARVAVGAEIAASPFQGLGPQPPRAEDIPDLATLPGIQAFGQDVRGRLTDLTGRTQKLQDLQLPADIQSSVDREFQRFEDDVTKQFKLFRPGADLATDTGYRDAILQVRQVRAEANAKARLEFIGVARQNLLAELSVNEQMLPYLGELASLDIQTLAARTGLTLQEANQFREIMGLLGIAVATGGRSLFSGFGQTQSQTPTGGLGINPVGNLPFGPQVPHVPGMGV